MDKFTKDVSERLDFYVYRLVDPRSGHTFYVGKGKGNRVFEHAHLADEFTKSLSTTDSSESREEDKLSAQVKTIYEILSRGLHPISVVHRHGMDEPTALEVESALIDAFLRLDNAQSGHDSERGPAAPTELQTNYGAVPFDVPQNINVLLISINRSAGERSVYHAVRYAWRMSKANAEKANLVLAIRQNICVGVFKPDIWLAATEENFPGFGEVEGRIGFIGTDVSNDKDGQPFMMKRLPKEWAWKQGQATPFQYKYG